MALTFPLAVADFFGDLASKVQSFEFDLGEALATEETGAGEILMADVGIRLWRLNCSMRPMRYAEAEQFKAKFDVLRYPARSLIAHAMPITYPQSDPDGSILGAAAVVLNTVNGNNRELRLSGLPAGYVITPGDVLSWQYGSNPIRYAFHRVVVGATADGAGLSGLIEVTPFVRPGYSLGTAVKLIKAEMKGIYVPGSLATGTNQGGWVQGIKFSFQQTLR